MKACGASSFRSSRVDGADLIRLFVAPLEAAGVPYMVTGGVAAVIYGDPRFTRDVDIVLDLAPTEASALLASFDERAFYLPPHETVVEESRREEGGHFNLIDRDTGLRADVYLRGSDPLHAWAFEHRRRVTGPGTGLWVAPPEYVILRKLQYWEASGSDRHLRDIAAMLEISGEGVDGSVLADWVERLGLEGAFAEAESYRRPSD